MSFAHEPSFQETLHQGGAYSILEGVAGGEVQRGGAYAHESGNPQTPDERRELPRGRERYVLILMMIAFAIAEAFLLIVR